MEDDIIAAKVDEAVHAAMRGRTSVSLGEAEAILVDALKPFMGPPPRWDTKVAVDEDGAIHVSISESRGPSPN